MQKGHYAKHPSQQKVGGKHLKKSYIRRYILEECNREQCKEKIGKHKTKRRMKDKPIRWCRSELWFGQ